MLLDFPKLNPTYSVLFTEDLVGLGDRVGRPYATWSRQMKRYLMKIRLTGTLLDESLETALEYTDKW